MIAILTDGAVGGTFLNWTIHYLAGHTQYWNCSQNQLVPLTNNPITRINAHNFKPNQPTSLKEFQKIVNSIDLHQHEQVATMYFHDFRNIQDTQQAITSTQQIADKIIFLTQSNNSALYGCNYAGRVANGTKWMTSALYYSPDEKYEDYTDYFFAVSKKRWKELGLTEIWDKREFIALNFDHSQVVSIKPLLNYSIPHFNIDTFDLWNTFDTIIPKLFKSLDLVVDESRIDAWLAVYRNWQKLHHDRQRFIWYFEKIINYIINGYSMDLEFLNLDIAQEAAIQRELIYKHNLNFKSWQLEKFQNTQQLHALLEDNIHPTTFPEK